MAYRWRVRSATPGASAFIPAALNTVAKYPVEATVALDTVFGSAGEFLGEYDPETSAVFPDEADVWTGTGAYGPTGVDYTPEKVASDIPNCIPGNIKDGVTIGDVTGILAGGIGGLGEDGLHGPA